MPELVSDERYGTATDRVKHMETLKASIESWTTKHTVAEVVDTALSKGVPASPIYNLKQIVEDEHIANVREMLVEVEHPVIGPLKIIGNPVKLMDTMPQIKKPSPTLGQHNADIYKGMLGISDTQMEQYLAEGVI